jgi:hypothetical protein
MPQPSEVINNPDLLARVQERLRFALLDYSPEARARYDAAGDSDQATIDSLIQNKARELVGQLASGAEQTNQTAHKYLNDPAFGAKEQLRDWLEQTINEQIMKLPQPTASPPIETVPPT